MTRSTGQLSSVPAPYGALSCRRTRCLTRGLFPNVALQPSSETTDGVR